MKHGFWKVAAASPCISLGDPAQNAVEIVRAAKAAQSEGAALVVFPELCLSGYSLGDLFLQSALRQSVLDALGALVRASEKLSCAMVIGLPLAIGGALYDCAALLCRGEICGIVPKAHLAEDQKRVFSPGEALSGSISLFGEEVPVGDLLFTVDEATVAIEIGCDVLAPISPSVLHTMAGAEVVVNPGASPAWVTRAQYLEESVKTLSGRLTCGYIYAGAAAGESTTDVVYSQHLFACENGELLAKSREILHQKPALLLTDLDLDRIKNERIKRGMGTDEAGNLHVATGATAKDAPLSRVISRSPFIPEVGAEERFSEIFDLQAAALSARLSCVKTTRAVIAVSGGLDSTLALLVTVHALDALGAPRENITAITMPGFGTSDRTYDNAMTLMNRLGLTVREISIKDACIQHFSDIGHDMNTHNAVYENGQARERTQIAMDIANQVGGIQVGTGDLSELALGWATYGGDHMSMYGVNGSIPKTLMQHMVTYAAHLPEFECVKECLLDIVATPISPELLPLKDGEMQQKTEGIVGPYELHDFFLFYLLRYGYSPKKIYFMACHAFAGVYEKEVIKTWLVTFLRRFFAQQFKRSCLPDGPAVGSVSVSPRCGWMVPTDARSTAWLREAEDLK